MKRRVKMLVSIAGLGDANPSDLAKKYDRMERDMRAKFRLSGGTKVRVFSDEQIASTIETERRKDAAEPRRGFSQDFSFKAGDEPLIDAGVAEKWEEGGICVAIQEPAKKAA